ncbi:DUF2231 domain-containing protein [Nocardioides marmorisolisilvae]|uniref:DUF2231 domain-containing protein n=1 Tax=Nocardioides marmorisolisilvae TaxID=1542737 RepID=A0A3N0DPY2_9ACTN|nr:DUF2231 domain-containing protein [Nocardioides marmorisolisilvae]RNL77702.1 hypothetical protein EFL95_17000 [Nocardioides marmorisolisilvae]
MLDTFQGLPVHALIVHATVVLLPLAAIAVALAAVHARFRAWIGWIAPAAAVACVVLTQLTVMSGNKLYARFERVHGVSKDLEHHKSLAHLLIWLVIPLAVIAVASYFLHRREDASKAVLGLVGALAVASAVSVMVDVALIGHAGATSAWKPIVENTNR